MFNDFLKYYKGDNLNDNIYYFFFKATKLLEENIQSLKSTNKPGKG